ncbi:hypothetical protein GQ457_05G016830 [Hibiscus cannabinus]
MSMGSASGMFRDNEGRWLLGFNKFLGMTSPLFAELCVIYIGLKLAGDNGFEYVQVQSDCHEAVKLLQDHSMVCSCISLVRAIDVYQRKCLVTETIWIPRDGNKPVDSLAKCIASLHSIVLILEQPHDYLWPLLAKDTFASPC